MNKKILIITDNIPDQINGVVTTYKNLEPYAKADGYHIEYIHPAQFKFVNLPLYPEIKLAFPKGMIKKINQIDPNYVHIATEGPLGIYARLIMSVKRQKYNTAYHTKFPEAIKKILGIPEFLTWPLIRWFHKNSNIVLTTTNSMVTELKENGFGENVIAWTRGVDREIFYPKYVGENAERILLNVGRVSAEKNLEAFYKLDLPGQKIQVGDGPKLEEYKRKYPNVKFVGSKTGKELADYYRSADVFVFPSKWDTFGLVQIESMACGTPVAAFPVTGPKDAIDQGVTGFMHDDLNIAVEKCLSLSKDSVYQGSLRWDWKAAWNLFKENLIEK